MTGVRGVGGERLAADADAAVVRRSTAQPIVAAVATCLLAGCPGPRTPGGGAGIAPVTLEIGRPGSSLTGVAGDGTIVFAALTARDSTGAPQGPAPSAAAAGAAATRGALTTIEALRPTGGVAPIWRTELAGYGGPIALAGRQLVAAIGGTGSAAGLALRGEPGAVVAALRPEPWRGSWPSTRPTGR
jgi:hypothetical protein